MRQALARARIRSQEMIRGCLDRALGTFSRVMLYVTSRGKCTKTHHREFFGSGLKDFGPDCVVRFSLLMFHRRMFRKRGARWQTGLASKDAFAIIETTTAGRRAFESVSRSQPQITGFITVDIVCDWVMVKFEIKRHKRFRGPMTEEMKGLGPGI